MDISNKFSIFSFVIFLPIFLSFSNSGDFIFNRVGGFSSEYMYTIPISFLWISVILFKSSIVIWGGKNTSIRNIFLFFLYSVLCIVINFLFNGSFGPSLLRVIFLLTIFLFLLELFDEYFSRIFASNQDRSSLTKKYILYPLGVILLITTLSDILLARGVFLSENFIVYNYEQYYAFVFVILSGAIMQSNLRQIFKFSVYLLSLNVALLSSNTTATLLMLFVFIWSFCYSKYLKHALFNLILTLSVVMIPVYYIIVYEYYEVGMLGNNFDSRASNIKSYINGLNWIEFLFPFVYDSKGFFNDMHSQFLEIFKSLGLIGVFYFFGVIFYKLKKIGVKYPDVGISLAIVIFIGGLVVNTSMHPYLSIGIAYIIAFYYRLSIVTGK